ncbi:MAG TPA: CAP domain-containing protein [Candidatus Limnocylindrales bacterium]|jgi:uncharacterized protein YkwD
MARRRPRAATLARLVMVALFASLALTTAGPLANPSIVAASTADTMEADLLKWVNNARAQRGLKPLRLHSGLVDLAGDQAAKMASSGSMQHISCMSCTFNNRGIQYYSVGENIAYTTYPWGDLAVASIYNGWKGSSMHWNLLMSSKFNYVGFGVAYRSSSHKTFAAAELSESKDRTDPSPRTGAVSRSGTTVSWSWSGADVALQTHTAGLKNYDVEYRVGSGSWSTIKSATTTTSLSLSGRATGHWYGLRIRARDNAGNVSGYSAEMKVWVP